MSLNANDLEQIERIIYKNGDDVAVSISRSFERIEERMEAFESRINERFTDLESVTALERADIIAKFDVLDKRVSNEIANIDNRLTELLEG